MCCDTMVTGRFRAGKSRVCGKLLPSRPFTAGKFWRECYVYSRGGCGVSERTLTISSLHAFEDRSISSRSHSDGAVNLFFCGTSYPRGLLCSFFSVMGGESRLAQLSQGSSCLLFLTLFASLLATTVVFFSYSLSRFVRLLRSSPSRRWCF